MALGSLVKTLQNIMRKDAGINGDAQRIEQAAKAVQHVIREDRGVGHDHALHRGMADVAFMPERLVFQRRQRVGADEAGQAGHVLGGDGVLLVRHDTGPRCVLIRQTYKTEITTSEKTNIGSQTSQSRRHGSQPE